MFYALICINNYIFLCIIYMLSRCDEILGQGNESVREGVPDDFLHALVLT